MRRVRPAAAPAAEKPQSVQRTGRPSKFTPEQWAEIRVLRESGASLRVLSSRFGVDQGTLSKVAKRDGWNPPAKIPPPLPPAPDIPAPLPPMPPDTPLRGRSGRRSKITPSQWADARAMRETGSSFGAISTKTGIDQATLCRTAQAQGWSDGADVAGVIRQRAEARTGGITNGLTPLEKSAALDAAAAKLAAKIEQHKTEWDAPRKTAYEAFNERDPAKMRMAKNFAETLKVIQEGERRAWGLEPSEQRVRHSGEIGTPADDAVGFAERVRAAVAAMNGTVGDVINA